MLNSGQARIARKLKAPGANRRQRIACAALLSKSNAAMKQQSAGDGIALDRQGKAAPGRRPKANRSPRTVRWRAL